MFVGSFEGDFVQFQTDTVSAMNAFQAAGVSRLLIDLTDNGGLFQSPRIFPDTCIDELVEFPKGFRMPWSIPTSVSSRL